jgi:protein SCO1/2
MSALPPIGRRGALGLLAGGLLMGAGLPLPALADNGWHDIDLSGVSPPLQLSMTRASDGKHVTQQDYVGRVSLLYFGYTYCPDVCPLTLSNLTQVLDKLGKQADRVRVLFVTVDPNRDSLAVLKQYMTSFGPQFVGLRGTPDALASLARRYRIEYSVSPASPGHPYEVTHSSAIYVFDTSGAARLLIPSMASQNPDINGVAADLHRLINGGPHKGLLSHAVDYLRGLV